MRLRVGVTHPLPVLKNAGIYARDLNANDIEKAKKVKTSFFEFAQLIAALTGVFTITEDGLKGPNGFGFIFTLTDK
jgi:hypothetical protein